MSNLGESMGQYVQQEAPDEFPWRYGYALLVFGMEGDAVFIVGDKPVIGNGHAVGVTAQVLKNVFRSAERLFGV